MGILTELALRVAAQPQVPDGEPQPPTSELGAVMNTWVGYAKFFALFAGVIGLIICAGMMAIGRRNRSTMAADGLSGVPWVVGGISLVALAVGIVTQVAGVG
ncbi:MAG: hypothetical protein L0Y54_22845 [Sporichthyaceae bacterium]|nr:hypothetical protein [Sporichthyaceae bacterium]